MRRRYTTRQAGQRDRINARLLPLGLRVTPLNPRVTDEQEAALRAILPWAVVRQAVGTHWQWDSIVCQYPSLDAVEKDYP